MSRGIEGKVLSPACMSAASKRHLVSVVLLLLTFATVSIINRPNGDVNFQADQRLLLYLRVSVMEWLLFAYVIFVVHRKGATAGMVINGLPKAKWRWLSSVGVGLIATLVWMALGAAMMAALRPTSGELRFIQSFLPHSVAEKFGFAILTLTAGFCEEFIYRGYIQQQLREWTGSLGIAIVLQAGLFALLHVTLPCKFIVSVAVMAIFLGVLVSWRRTLIPAMLLHTLVNLIGGFLSSVGATA
jgi:uncharacterized protein